MNPFDLDKIYKKNIGDFILTFSTIEFTLALIISRLNYGNEIDPLKNPQIFKMDFSKKKKNIREKLKANKELFKMWEKIETKLNDCNETRRFIAHGTLQNHLPNPSLTFILPKIKNKIEGYEVKEITNEILLENLKKIVNVHTGIEGVEVLYSKIKDYNYIHFNKY